MVVVVALLISIVTPAVLMVEVATISVVVVICNTVQSEAIYICGSNVLLLMLLMSVTMSSWTRLIMLY